MARMARFTVEDGIYHVMTRGNNKQTIFHSEGDFKTYLKFLKENKTKFNIKIYHYALMRNHVHLILKAATGKNLSDMMKRLNVFYTNYYRKKYGGVGHFFQDRFKSFIIQSGSYLLECGRYVELNPVKAGIVRFPGEYRWSSYTVYAAGQKSDLVDISPEYEGLSEKPEVRQRNYKEFVEQEETEKRDEGRFFRVGAYGSKEFVKRMQERGLRSRWAHSGTPRWAKK